MHNRARMVVASFLAKDLGIDWREGARHFFDLLLDGDVAQNVGNWQWVAGTGVDTRPNRVYNPIAQAKKLDPDGAYIRRYVSRAGRRARAAGAPAWSTRARLSGSDRRPRRRLSRRFGVGEARLRDRQPRRARARSGDVVRLGRGRLRARAGPGTRTRPSAGSWATSPATSSISAPARAS